MESTFRLPRGRQAERIAVFLRTISSYCTFWSSGKKDAWIRPRDGSNASICSLSTNCHVQTAPKSEGSISTAPTQSAQVASNKPNGSSFDILSFFVVTSSSQPSGKRFSKKG